MPWLSVGFEVGHQAYGRLVVCSPRVFVDFVLCALNQLVAAKKALKG